MVCTGNQCRSPMAEALLRHQLGERGVSARVSSVGTLVEGRPATPTAVEVLASRGLDLGGHSSRILSAELVAGSDLVVCMAREHVRAAAVAHPEAFPRIYTLKELVRRGNAVGPRQDGEPLEGWLARVHDGRRAADMMSSSTEDDVFDPIGEPRATYERIADEISGLLAQLVPLVWGLDRPAPARLSN